MGGDASHRESIDDRLSDDSVRTAVGDSGLALFRAQRQILAPLLLNCSVRSIAVIPYTASELVPEFRPLCGDSNHRMLFAYTYIAHQLSDDAVTYALLEANIRLSEGAAVFAAESFWKVDRLFERDPFRAYALEHAKRVEVN